MSEQNDNLRKPSLGKRNLHTGTDSYGALVGWKSHDFHDRIILRLQIVRKPPPHGVGDVEQTVYVLDKNQAVQIGNYLYDVCGQSLP